MGLKKKNLALYIVFFALMLSCPTTESHPFTSIYIPLTGQRAQTCCDVLSDKKEDWSCVVYFKSIQ